MAFIDRVKDLLFGEAGRNHSAFSVAFSALDEIARLENAYDDLDCLNITAIIAGKLSNIVCAEAGIIFPESIGDTGGEGAGARKLRREPLPPVEAAVSDCFAGLRNIAARVFGTGGVLLRPYSVGGRIFIEWLPQSRFFVIKRYGETIVKAGILAEAINEDGRELTRFETHELSKDGYIIENRAFDGEREISLRSVKRWEGIEPRRALQYSGSFLFTLLKCPVEPRGAILGGGAYGVPVTYGQEKLLQIVEALLDEIPHEYINKRAFIGAEDLLFDSRDRLPQSGLYKLVRGCGGEARSFWEVFSPEIRHTSYFEGLNYLFGLVEKAVLVNKGVLTDLDASDATATAIRRSMFDTYNIIDAMRKNIERAFLELLTACSILERETTGVNKDINQYANDVRFDWSYALLEDTSETFKQLMEAYKEGIIGAEEVRRFII